MGFRQRLNFDDIWTDDEFIQPWMYAIVNLVLHEEYIRGFGDRSNGTVD